MKKLANHACSTICPSSAEFIFGNNFVKSNKVSSCLALMFCFPRPMGHGEADSPLNAGVVIETESDMNEERVISSSPSLTNSENFLTPLSCSLNNDVYNSSRRSSSDRDVRYHSCSDGLQNAPEAGETATANSSLQIPPDANKERRTSAPETLALMPCVMSSGTRSPGPKYKLLQEGDIQVCFVNHIKTVVNKILCSKMLRRWENHHLYLNDSCISSKTPSRYWRKIDYTSIQEISAIARWDMRDKYLIQITLHNACVLLQTNNAYIRDQWFYSIHWKKNMFKYQSLLTSSTRQDVILKETKNLVDVAVTTPLQDPTVTSTPIAIVSQLLADKDAWTCRPAREIMITVIAPLLENTPPSIEMCTFFSDHCTRHPRSPVILEVFTPIVLSILKHTVDFGKTPYLRKFVQDYILSLYSHNSGKEVVKNFIASAHGPVSGCPHHRVLNNLVAVCLAAIVCNFEERQALQKSNELENLEQDKDDTKENRLDKNLKCYLYVFRRISKYEDWRPGLAVLLQPIPFPDDTLGHDVFMKNFFRVLERISTDSRCDVHQMVLGVREGKNGWFDVCSPSSMACTDEGHLWGLMLSTLLGCCCKRKKFIIQVMKQLDSCVLLALRGFSAAQDALCLMLEWDLIDSEERKDQIITVLQSTENGKTRYTELCDTLMDLQKLQQKGGPRKLSLPNRSTDADLAQMLSRGSFGNLECLSLAFTHVTSACAEQLIKLPHLRYLNLWATQFGDQGVIVISEHLNLEDLNLCETLVSDKGIAALSAMTSLRKLNLNSTRLSPQTFQTLQEKLPTDLEYDVRYTDAYS